MSKFESLSPSGLPKEFDAELFSEKPIISVDEREACIEIHYVFPGFTVGDTAQQIDEQTMPFKEIGISGAGFMSESGKPLMPSFGRFIQIPPGSDYNERGSAIAGRRHRIVRHMAERQPHERPVRCHLAWRHQHLPGNDGQLCNQAQPTRRYPQLCQILPAGRPWRQWGGQAAFRDLSCYRRPHPAIMGL